MKNYVETQEVMDWGTVNQLVKPEHQYQEVKDAPLPSVRMAWPFKTEEELILLTKWFKAQQKQRKQEEKQRVIELAQALF